MFQKSESPDIWQSWLQQTSPCACCAPIISRLNGFMAIRNEALASPDHWRSAAPPLAPIATGTRLMVNAKIYTVDGDFSKCDAMAIADGKIVATGDAKILTEQFDDAEVVDCAGRTILPGFIEPHMHFLPIATIGQFADVGPFRFSKIDEALAHLKSLLVDLAEDEWLVGRQFDPSLQEGADILTRHMLDTVSTTRAILVYNASLHFAYCNTKALELAGVNQDSPDGSGSSFGRDSDGVPNGVLQGSFAMGQVAKHNPAQASYDLTEACLQVCHRANAVGVTTFCDQATGVSRGVQELDLYRALGESGRMTARLRYSLSYALQEKWDRTDARPGDGNEMVRLTAWKIVADGSNQGFSGLQREPYLNSEDRGIAYVEPEALIEMVKDRAGQGWPLAIHANGDQAIDHVLDAYEAANEAGLLTHGPYRIEHCSILHDEQIQRIKKLGLSPSFLIGHVYYWGKAMRDNVFGAKKAALLDRTRACEEAGIRWTLHSDEPVTEMGPLRCIQNAVTRDMWKEEGSKLAPEEAVDVQSAIRAMTIDAAWQCHSDHEVGSLEAGKLADFVILADDPHTCPQNEISEIPVLETWMGGRQVYYKSASR
ncbi:MAG: putative amidohydrolase YtcJ [Candidatus Azotimanducaceae bacterium]|jgi:predicted amidohydrolase YtcJ